MENKKASLIKIDRKLDSIRGIIISSASRIEFSLGYKLRRYFYPKTNDKATILFWNVINTSYLSFDSKISIYESIPYFKKLKCYPKVKKSLIYPKIEKHNGALGIRRKKQRFRKHCYVYVYS